MFAGSAARPRPSCHPLVAPHRAPRTAQVWVAASLGLATALAGSAGVAVAQAGVGAAYGARDPHPCPTVQATATRPPDVATATAVVICKAEHVNGSNSLFLLSNVRVQVGGGTPFRELPGIHRPGGADPAAIVYAIRGSYTQYLCSAISAYTKAGENCRRYDYPRAEGTCFRDNFGEWACHLLGDAQPTYGTDKQPAPRS